LDNFRAALGWSLSDDGNPDTGLRLVGSLRWFWYLRGRLQEGRSWAERLTIRGMHAPLESRARALFAVGGMALMQGNPAAAQQALERSVALFRESRDQRRLAEAVAFLGMAADSVGTPRIAWAHHQEAIELAAVSGDRWLQALALTSQGAASRRLGDLDSADRLYHSSLSLFRELQDPWGYSIALRGRAALMFDKGERGSARALYEQSVPLFRETCDTRGLAQTLLGLGRSALHDGAASYAREIFVDALACWKEVDVVGGVIRCLVGLASVAAVAAHRECALRLYAATDSLAMQHGVSLSGADAAYRAGSLADIRQSVGHSRFEAVWSAGATMTLDEAIESALTPCRSEQDWTTTAT
jgi:tetratricopeptide (TPR) repeat protein